MKSKFFLFVFIPFLILSGCKSHAQYYDGHDFVDLGLSVNWATLNIGSSYQYYRGDLIELNPLSQNDTVTVLWGEKWRMPTKKEFQELIDNCQWEWDKENQGYNVIGKNGNSIYLPAGGFKSGDRDLLNYGSAVYLWGSRDPESRDEPKAWMFSAVSGPNSRMGVYSSPMSLQVAHSIRPVTDEPFVPIKGIGINKKKIEIEIGQEYQLTASFIPSNATPKHRLWYSGNSAVAAVDHNGKVTGISSGKCTIIVVCGDYKEECQVNVTAPKGYTAPQQEEAVTIFKFGGEVNSKYVNPLDNDYDDSALEVEEAFKAHIGPASSNINVTLIKYAGGRWSDPGDFFLIKFDVNGKHYQFKNFDWVLEDWFDNSYFHCCQISKSQYLLFLKGFNYGCCPGKLTVFAIDETGVRIVFNQDYYLTELNRDPFSMTLHDDSEEYVSDTFSYTPNIYTLFIEDGALKLRLFSKSNRK